ncbi:Outer membrane usher protein like [Actinidia chinensis var. chinensis]|uniref:Outer membrane usher protein like n=1 Tax=Actinidia chinensis var. chinensis TaxID=1590841 RepID=A0A2R6Q2D8_ACTCC|nr:Outer membrane usher protein like [Actinidia chinensis var. chinensis]
MTPIILVKMSVDVSAVGLALGLDIVSPPANGVVTEAAFSGVATKGEIRTEAEESSESSSIGVPDDSDDEEGEVESKPNGSLPSLASLEESLPIKRGLSSHLSGKSKSFGNLSELRTVKEMVKIENPLNKRRRTMIAYNWSKKNRSSLFGCMGNPTSMPLLSLNEDEEEPVCHRNQEEEDEDGNGNENERRRQHLKSSKSCFSLTPT